METDRLCIICTKQFSHTILWAIS